MFTNTAEMTDVELKALRKATTAHFAKHIAKRVVVGVAIGVAVQLVINHFSTDENNKDN